MTRSIAELGAGPGSCCGRTVTGRDCRTCSSPSGANAHSMSWRAPKYRSTRQADLDERRERGIVQARSRAKILRHLGPLGTVLPGHVPDCLLGDLPAHDLAGDLVDQEVVGRHLAADDREPEPQLALIATTLGSPLTGLHVNMTPDTSASTIT